MTGKLQKEIKQKKPFASVEAEAYLSILRTADVLAREFEQLLKPHGLTATQYNVLRILRGAGERGATCSDIGERLITADPDVTRLLDRMEKAGLVERARDTKDRRVVLSRITADGVKLVNELDEHVHALHADQLRHLSKQRLRELIEDLDEVRARRES